MGQGTSPLWGLGQRPKVLKPSISAIFKVHLSLFFRLSFFIDYLTLPGMRDADKARIKVFGLVKLEEHTQDDIPDRMEQAVKE